MWRPVTNNDVVAPNEHAAEPDGIYLSISCNPATAAISALRSLVGVMARWIEEFYFPNTRHTGKNEQCERQVTALDYDA